MKRLPLILQLKEVQKIWQRSISKKIIYFKSAHENEDNSTLTLKVENIDEYNNIKSSIEKKVKLISSEFVS